MTRSTTHPRPSLLCGLLLFLFAIRCTPAQAPPAALAAFDQYTLAVEARLLQQHAAATSFLVLDPHEAARLEHGDELDVEQLSRPNQPAGAMLHHWRGTAFAPGASSAQFTRLLQNVSGYPRVFGPQVVVASGRLSSPRSLQADLRVRQRHVITVVMDVSYDVSFGQLDSGDGYSASKSLRIREIAAPGSNHERALPPNEEHGFLWRLNTYWTYQERDGGLFLQLESVSLSRSIPAGLGWALRPYVTSVPRESLELTLRAAVQALERQNVKGNLERKP